jgi:CRISPR/Cas system CSM-associated protein Csm3 (group 7 of RAMP superfamily)
MRYWHPSEARKVNQRLVIQGDLTLVTPASFSNGDPLYGETSGLTDLPLITDGRDPSLPLLTGASLAGALRAYCNERQSDEFVARLFGDSGDNDEQSRLLIDDALGQKPSTELRQGVKIDGKTRTAEDRKLYDRQLWSRGTCFPIRLEILFFENDNNDLRPNLLRTLLTALEGLTNGDIRLGGRKNRGLGKVVVSSWRYRIYDMFKLKDLYAWLNEDAELNAVEDFDALARALKVVQPLPDKRKMFQLEATFALENTLLIRSYPAPASNQPDMVHLQSGGKPILSGTSLTGALRARAVRILKTLGYNAKIAQFFGAEEDKTLIASRLVVDETEIEKPAPELIHTRVSIDRFTGGALDKALFEQVPVFASDETRIKVNLRLKQAQEAEIGLLLLLLKDLWTSDLPLGGESSVGRGRLRGLEATLSYNGKTWCLEANGGEPSKLKIEGDKEALEQFVNALHQKGKAS